MIKEEAVKTIVDYGMMFWHSALFMVKEKYLDLDFSDINFSNMRGHEEGGVPKRQELKGLKGRSRRKG